MPSVSVCISCTGERVICVALYRFGRVLLPVCMFGVRVLSTEIKLIFRVCDASGGLFVISVRAGVATRYGLDGPGIESLWGEARFSALIQTGPGAHPASRTMGTGLFPGGELWDRLVLNRWTAFC